MRKRKPYIWEENENGCMQCTSHKRDKLGRTSVKINNEIKLLHRVIYEECFGEIPKGMVIRHKCDNNGCINPEHLEIGTQKDNIHDMINRGRKPKTRKLSTEQIKEIRKSNLSARNLAKIYGVDKTTILNYKKLREV